MSQDAPVETLRPLPLRLRPSSSFPPLTWPAKLRRPLVTVCAYRNAALAAAVGFLDRPIDLALRLTLGDRGALVVLALAFGQGNLHLEASAAVVQPQRHQREPGLL